MWANNTTATSGDVLPITTELWKVWLSAFSLVTLINTSSILGIFFMPLMRKKSIRAIMRTMIGLAIGSLSGSALFHLIPAAFRFDSRAKDDYLNIALTIWMAAWVIMVVECCIKICVKMRAAARARARESMIKSEENGGEATASSDETVNSTSITTNGGDTEDSLEQLPVYRSTLSLSKIPTDSDPGARKGPDEPIKSVAWIIIIGDSVHNFIDGISIGTAFANNFNTGIVISVAILCEEIPHELGDFAILINSGMSVKRAIGFNLLSALSCYAGMTVGILLGAITWGSFIYAFAAGIFLYVALADMVPELTSRVDKVSDTSPIAAIRTLMNYNLGILVGISILYVLAVYQQ